MATQDIQYSEQWDAAQDADITAEKAVKDTKADDDFEFDTSEPASRAAERAKPVAEEPKAKDYSASSFRAEFKRAMAAGEKSFEWKRPDGSMYRVAAVLKSKPTAKPVAKAEAKVDNSIPWTDPKAATSPKAEPKRERSVYDGSIADTGPAAAKELYNKMTTPSDKKVQPLQTGGGKSVVDTSMQVGMGKPKSMQTGQSARGDK